MIALCVVVLTTILVAGKRWRPMAVVVGLALSIGAIVFFAAFAPASIRDRIAADRSRPGSGAPRAARRSGRSAGACSRTIRSTASGSGASRSPRSTTSSSRGRSTRTDQIIDSAQGRPQRLPRDAGRAGDRRACCCSCAILAFPFVCALLAARNFARVDDLQLEVLSRALVVALAGILAADFFVSAQLSKLLWLLLAMGPVLLAISRKALSSAPTSLRRGSPPTRLGRAQPLVELRDPPHHRVEVELGPPPLTAARAHLAPPAPGRRAAPSAPPASCSRMVPLDQQPVVAVGRSAPAAPPTRVATTGSSGLHVLEHRQRTALELRAADGDVHDLRAGRGCPCGARGGSRSPSGPARRSAPPAGRAACPSPAISTRTSGKRSRSVAAASMQHRRAPSRRPQHAHGADHRRPGVDARARRAGRAPPGGGGLGSPFGITTTFSGSMRSISIIRLRSIVRDGDERVGAPRDHVAVDEAAQGLALERPRVLVRDDHRRPGQAAEDRPPPVRPVLDASAGRRCAAGRSSRKRGHQACRCPVVRRGRPTKRTSAASSSSSTFCTGSEMPSSGGQRVTQIVRSKRSGSSPHGDLARETLGPTTDVARGRRPG